MTKQFETTFIIDSYLSDQEIETSITKYTKFIEKNSGVVKSVDRWGKRRLAYEIKKKQYGYYVYVRFEMDGSKIKELEREYKLDDSILRYLTVLVPQVVVSQEHLEKKQPDLADADSNEKDEKEKPAEPEEVSEPEKVEDGGSTKEEEQEEVKTENTETADTGQTGDTQTEDTQTEESEDEKADA